MRRHLTIAALSIAVLGAAPATAGAMPAGDPTATSSASRATLRLQSSQFGRVLFNGRGRAVYAFTADRGRRSRCYGACARAWPPFIVSRRPRAGRGVRAARIGVTRRRDGRLQATYAGKPLYFYVDDPRNRVLCHNIREFGGLWLALRGSGRAVS